MSESRLPNESWLDFRKRVLDPVSSSFCAAKSLDATIWLGHGATASCHLPPAHKIDVAALADNPSAIHNTAFKKKMRKLMLEGHRPKECDYCWKMEDMQRDNMSDRMFKSAQFTQAGIDSVTAMPWDADLPLETLEIAFNRACQFACSYCNAGFSTTWAQDINAHGAYQNLATEGAGAFQHNGDWAEPFGKLNAGNPYVDAFWRWWPELRKTLKRLRITGGEPLMSVDVWKLFDHLKREGSEGLCIAVNSNLGGKKDLIDRLIARSHDIEHLEIYTSNEGVGAQAEYIRDGLDYDLWKRNVERLLRESNVRQVQMMMTINALCLFSLPEFLDQLVEWKAEFGARAPIWSANILRFPSFMSPLVLPADIRRERADALIAWLDRNARRPGILDFEIDHLRRLIDYLELVERPHESAADLVALQRDFKTFHVQYDARRDKTIGVFPKAFRDWFDAIEVNDLGRHQPLISGAPI